MGLNKTSIEGRYQTLLILWLSITMSVAIFFGIALFMPVTRIGDARISVILNCAGLIPLALSFLLKSQILNKAARQQRLEQVQVAYVLSFALAEMSALLGLADHFANGGPYFYVGFLVAGLGMLLHFPQKKHLLAAEGREF